MEEAYPEQLAGPTGLGPALGILASSAKAAALDAWSQRTGQPIGPDDVEPDTWARAEEGRSYSAVQVHAAHDRLVAGVCAVASWWVDRFDLLVTPTMAQLPPRLDEPLGAGTFGLFTMPYYFAGQPAISLPLH